MVRPEGDEPLDEPGSRLHLFAEPRLGLGPEQGPLDRRLGPSLRELDRLSPIVCSRRRHGRSGGHRRRVDVFGAPFVPPAEMGLQGHGTGGKSVLANERNIRGPQFLQEKAARIAGRVGQAARTRAEPEPIEGRHGRILVRSDRHWGLTS